MENQVFLEHVIVHCIPQIYTRINTWVHSRRSIYLRLNSGTIQRLKSNPHVLSCNFNEKSCLIVEAGYTLGVTFGKRCQFFTKRQLKIAGLISPEVLGFIQQQAIIIFLPTAILSLKMNWTHIHNRVPTAILTLVIDRSILGHA